MHEQPTLTTYKFYLKPLHPCKIGSITQDFLVYKPYGGVSVIGPVASRLETILPVIIEINTEEVKQEELAMMVLPPFQINAFQWGKKFETLGAMLVEASKH